MNNLRPSQHVWFYAGPHETVMQSDQPLAAIVTYVHAHRHVDAKASPLVNLTVFGKDGSVWARQSIHIWDGDGDSPERGSYARFQEDDAAEAKRADAANAPKRGWGETEDAHKARLAKWRDERGTEMPARASGENEDGYRARVAKWQSERPVAKYDPAVQADGQAKSNADHGPPRGSPSPYSGGPLSIDDHEPMPQAETAQMQHVEDRKAANAPKPAQGPNSGGSQAESSGPKQGETKEAYASRMQLQAAARGQPYGTQYGQDQGHGPL